VEIPSELGGGFLCLGETGAITRIRNGTQRRVVEGLPSYGQAGPEGSCAGVDVGSAVLGPSDVAVRGDRQLVIAMGFFGPPAGRDVLASKVPYAVEFGTIKSVRPGGRERTLADLVRYEAQQNPDRGELESNPYSLALLRGGGILVADASGNDVLRVGPRGRVSTVAVLSDEPRAVPPLSCPLPPGFPPVGTVEPSEAVPNSITVGPDGAYYVGQLTGFPFVPGMAKVFRVDPATGATTEYAAGFTAITDIAFGPDGSLYVLELAREGLFEALICGKTAGRLVEVTRGHRKEIRVPGLDLPGGVDVADDGTIYVTNRSIQPEGAGQVLRIARRS
jgi:hypothetical protein